MKKKKLRGVKLGQIMSLQYTLLNRPTTGVIYKDEEGFHLQFDRILGDDETEIVHFHLSSEDDLDGEDLLNINEILEMNSLEFNGYLKEA